MHVLVDAREFEKGKATGLSRTLSKVIKVLLEKGYTLSAVVDEMTDKDKVRFAKKLVSLPRIRANKFSVAIDVALLTSVAVRFDLFVTVYPKFPPVPRCVFFVPDMTFFSRAQKAFLAVFGKIPRTAITHTDYWKTKLESLTQRKFEKIPLDISYIINAKPRKPPRKLPEKFILYVGNTKPHKNLPTLLRAWEMIKNSLPDTWLVVAGGEERQDTERKVLSLPTLTDGELAYLYSNCLAFAFVSLSEGVGLPPLEAGYFGAPLVLSKIPVFREIWGDAPVWADPHSSRSVAKAVLTCIENARDVSRRCRQIALSFAWQKFESEFARIV